jgi:MoaA/NifB/PqqE/SkfB family radical SAM enzyme
VNQVEQVEIQLGHLCNNRCVFCSSGLITSFRLVGQEAPDPAMRQLEAGRQRGATKVTFVGGEPTLQRDFPRFVELARRLGYREIVVFTNGVRTHQREYLRALVAGGPLTFRISIQGGDEATHDRVTGRVGSFQRIIDGMALMNELGQKITCNACLNVSSYRSVAGYPALAKRFGIQSVHLDQINPLEIGNQPPGHLEKILVAYSEQAPHLERMLSSFDRLLGPDYDISLGNLPYCVMPDWAHRIHHAGEPTLVVQANLDGPAPEGHDKYERKTKLKLKPESCASCAFDPVCTGVFNEYAELIGTDELVPVPAERLRAGKHAWKLFTLLEREPLARLAQTEPPAGVQLIRATIGPQEAEAQLLFEAGGEPIALTLRHPSAPGPALASSERIAIHVPGGRADALAKSLVSWAFDCVREPGQTELIRPTLDEIERRQRWGMAARRQLSGLVGALTSGNALHAFRVGAVRWAFGGEAASLLVAKDGSDLWLRLTTMPPFETPRVSATVSAASGDVPRAAATELIKAVRESLTARA